MNSDCDEQLFFPSEIVSIDIEGSTGKYEIKIPKREVPTVKDIFEKHEYVIAKKIEEKSTTCFSTFIYWLHIPTISVQGC